MLIACWSAKGGSGTTVVATALALVLARRSPDVRLADLAGDIPAVLGLPDPAGPGLAEWMAAGDEVPADALGRLAVEVRPGLTLLPAGGVDRVGPSAADGERLAAALASGGVTVVDCGSTAGAGAMAVAGAATVSLLVLRPCYLAVRRALAAPIRPSGIVLVREPERALTPADIEAVLGVPVRAEVPWRPAIARVVDAGLLGRRVPSDLARSLQAAA